MIYMFISTWLTLYSLDNFTLHTTFIGTNRILKGSVYTSKRDGQCY